MPDIRSMIQTISNTGLLKPNLFTVSVTFPDILFPEGTSFAQERNITAALASRTSRVTLPENTLEVYELISDARMTLPIARSQGSFPPISFAMILSEDARERKYFEDWIKKIHGYENGYSPLFYDNYVSPGVVVSVISNTSESEIATKFYFYNAYPISVGDVELAYEENDTYTVCTITMNYESWNRA